MCECGCNNDFDSGYDYEPSVVRILTLPDGVFAPRGEFLPKSKLITPEWVQREAVDYVRAMLGMKPSPPPESRQAFYERVWGEKSHE